MSANACPQNIWNHTDGCTCTPNGSVTSEVDVDLNPDLTGLSAASKTRIADLAAARLADPEFVGTFPRTAALYADEGFLDDARALEGQPLMLAVQFQHWDGRDNAIDAHSTTFDLAPVMHIMDDTNRHALAEHVLDHGYSNDEGDGLYIEARDRGIVESHDGPFYVYDPTALDRAQVAAWDLANPAPADRSKALMSVASEMYSDSYQKAVNARRDLFIAERRQERLALAKRLLDEDVPAGSTVALKIHGGSADDDGNCNISLGQATDADGNVIESWRPGLRVNSMADRYGNTRYDAFLDDNDQDRIAVDKVYDWVAAGAPADTE
jgi:hypothetical protein